MSRKFFFMHFHLCYSAQAEEFISLPLLLAGTIYLPIASRLLGDQYKILLTNDSNIYRESSIINASKKYCEFRPNGYIAALLPKNTTVYAPAKGNPVEYCKMAEDVSNFKLKPQTQKRAEAVRKTRDFDLGFQEYIIHVIDQIMDNKKEFPDIREGALLCYAKYAVLEKWAASMPKLSSDSSYLLNFAASTIENPQIDNSGNITYRGVKLGIAAKEHRLSTLQTAIDECVAEADQVLAFAPTDKKAVRDFAAAIQNASAPTTVPSPNSANDLDANVIDLDDDDSFDTEASPEPVSRKKGADDLMAQLLLGNGKRALKKTTEKPKKELPKKDMDEILKFLEMMSANPNANMGNGGESADTNASTSSNITEMSTMSNASEADSTVSQLGN